MRNCEVSRKLVGSWKLESEVNKGDVREIKKGRLRKEKKKTILKHECGIVIILTFEFKQISILLF
jgi:hypothetical protein